MVDKEKRQTIDDTGDFMFWEKKKDSSGKILYVNKALDVKLDKAPELSRGGILAGNVYHLEFVCVIHV